MVDGATKWTSIGFALSKMVVPNLAAQCIERNKLNFCLHAKACWEEQGIN